MTSRTPREPAKGTNDDQTKTLDSGVQGFAQHDPRFQALPTQSDLDRAEWPTQFTGRLTVWMKTRLGRARAIAQVGQSVRRDGGARFQRPTGRPLVEVAKKVMVASNLRSLR